MSVEKTFGYGNASPYRSDTFNRNNDHIFGRNGGLEITSIENSGGNVVIGDIKFIQNGIIVKKVGSSQETFPTTLPAPFYLTATVPDSKPIDNIAWSFVRRPQDIGDNTVLIAEWDGSEWRHLPEISIKGLVDHRLSEAVAYKNVGFNSGFRFSPNPTFTEYSISPGQVTDKTGLLVEKLDSTPFNEISADLEYDRIDAILWRRWMDDPNRIGQLILRPGQTYAGSSIVQNHKTTIGNSANVNHHPTVLNPSDNSHIVLWIEHYGSNGVLKFNKYAEDRTTELVAPLDLSPGVVEYSAVLDKDDNIMVAYVRDDNLYRMKIDSDGATLVSPTAIDGLLNPVSKPVIKTDFLGYFYVTFLYEISPSLYNPYFLKMNTGGTISVPSKRLIDSTSSYNKVHFDINEDFECFVAYENETLGTIEYQKIDEVGEQLFTRITVSDDTMYGLVTISGTSRNPTVTITENNELYIAYEQDKGVGNYGLAFYSPEYDERYGHKSVLKDFESASEDILDHAIDVDWGNHAHLMVRTSSKLFYFNYLLPYTSTRLLATFTINPVASGESDLKFDRAGSLIQAFSNEQSGTTNNGAPIGALLFGPGTYGTESVYLADNEVAVLVSSLAALSPVPTVKDSFTVANSTQGNDGTYTIDYQRLSTIDGSSYAILRDDAATFAIESGTAADAQFTKLNGTALYFAKQTPTTEYNFQEVKAEELDSDILCVVIRKSDNVFFTWYDLSLVPASDENVRMESFLTSKGTVNFDKDAAGGTLIWSQDILIRVPFMYHYKIASSSQTGLLENKVLYTRIPKSISLAKDGDTDGFGTLTVDDVSQFTIGKNVYVGDSDSDGIEATIDNIVDNQLIFTVSMANYSTVRGAYVVPSEVDLIMEDQNKGDLRPDSLGNIDRDIYVVAMRVNDLVHFRAGALTLEHEEDGKLGDGTSDANLTFMGATNQADSAPAYGNQFGGTPGEGLSTRTGNLDRIAEHEAQNRNLIDFFAPGMAFTWDAALGELTWAGSDWELILPDKGSAPGVVHTVNTATKKITLSDNQVAYIDIDRVTATGDLTPIVVNDNALPLNSTNQDHIVIARRRSDAISIGIGGRFTLADGQSTGDAPTVKLIKGGNWDWDLGTDTVSWDAEAHIQIQSLANSVNRIAAGSAVLDADGKVAYVSINQVAPGGLLTVQVADIDTMSATASNIIIARRIDNNILVGHNLLEDGSVIRLDQSFTNNMLSLIGFSSTGQTAHTYPSTYYITQSTSHTDAIGILDLKLSQLEGGLADNLEEYTWLSDGISDTFEVGTGGHGEDTITFSPDNDVNDIIVFVDGNKKELHAAGTWPIGDGDTDGEFIKTASNTIRLKPSLLAGAGSGDGRCKITVRPYAAGKTHVVAVKDEGSTVESSLDEINFKGFGVTVTQTSPGKVDVDITTSGGGSVGDTYKLFTATNNTGSTIPAKRAVRFLPNGEIELCDNAVSGKKNPMAVTVVEIPDGDTVTDSIAIGYSIPGVLSGLSFGFNERVFLGSNGELVNEASVPDTPSLEDALIQVGEAYGSGTSTTDLIWNKQEYSAF